MATVWTRRAGHASVTTVVSGRWRQNGYVIADVRSGEAAIVDPGGAMEDLRKHTARLRVVAVLLTHGHYDHLGMADALVSATGATCWIHHDDAALMRQAPAYAVAFERRVLRLPDTVAEFDAGQRFSIGDLTVRVDRFPGHTPGSVAYRIDDLIFSGDTLLRQAIGRTDLPGGDEIRLRESIETMLADVPDEATLLPGHGRPWTVGEAREWWRERREG
jgi:glyoxylase-like metal-dependent hydrolase (beta-lactamase superfamily II)